LSGGYGTNKLANTLAGRNLFLKLLIQALYPPMPTLNIIEQKKLEAIQKNLFSCGATIVNVGSGGISGCGYRLWKTKLVEHAKIFHMDIVPGDSVTLLGDAHQLPFSDNSIDCLIFQAVLEHVKDPRGVINEAERVLKPGGMIYLEVPFLQGFHADPYDYQRYTLEGLRILTEEFYEVDAGVSVGPFCTLVWIIRDGLSSCFRNRFLYAVSRFVAGWALSPLRYFDFFIRNHHVSQRLACEYYYLCQKPL
jgi:SAM-dependent methyltransferase